MSVSVQLAPGADNNGLALMLAQLIRQNVDEREEKRVAMARMTGRAAIVVLDLGMAVTLDFLHGQLTVHSGVFGVPDLSVRTTSEWVTKMSLIEILPRLGIPDPRGEVAKEVSEATRAGLIKTLGSASSPIFALRLTNVLSVA